MASFEQRHGVPQIVGAIDGTHIPVAIPADDNWKGYINRKSWASIVFQCVVDGEGNFRNVGSIPLLSSPFPSSSMLSLSSQVSGGGAGSMHDSRLFRRSLLGQSMQPTPTVPPMIPPGSFLIGDAGYPSNVNILLPYPSVLEPANEWFNFVQSSTQIVVEQAFGRLKNRFRLLLHSQMASPARSRNNTFACMILHNLLNRRGTLYLQDWEARTLQEAHYNELPNPAPDPILAEHSHNILPSVSMWTKRDIIRDYLYQAPP
jgi:hypothetical protein